jgi:DNA-binding GntR family transcriptional regulator
MASSRKSLAHFLARKILDEITLGRIEVGQHLSAQRLADRFGVSRSPVREALQLLSIEGFTEQKANRGFFARNALPTAAAAPGQERSLPFDPPSTYQGIADDWLANRIPADVTEQMLRARYDLTKAQLGAILLRAAREGWAERKPGYGWRLLSVAKTPEAFEQIYRFRMLIEPAAMLEPTFQIQRAVTADLRAIQQRMLDSDIERLGGERLLDNGSRFHEDLIRFSGNPFFHQALVRVNRMRRLMEYRSHVDRRRLYTQCSQHLEILDLLEQGDVVEASSFMRRHLGGALAQKASVVVPPLEEASPPERNEHGA